MATKFQHIIADSFLHHRTQHHLYAFNLTDFAIRVACASHEMSDGGRHMACTSCRDRKVKRDGAQPSCQRCSRYSVRCVYIPPLKQSKVGVDPISMNEKLREHCFIHLQIICADRKLGQAERALAAQQDVSRSYQAPVSHTISNDENTSWLDSIPSVSTFSPTELSQFFQHSLDYPLAPSSNVKGTTNFPLNDPVAWNVSNMMAANIPDTGETGEWFAFGGGSTGASDTAYSGENSSQWPSVDSSSSSDHTMAHITEFED